ncbi:hypothetical protein ACB092_01G209500 [Castanea dentata]
MPPISSLPDKYCECALLSLQLFLLGFVNAVSQSEEYKTYMIHMHHSDKPESFLIHESWHRSILNSLLPSPADNKELLLYSYNHVMHGFSARLTPSLLSEIEKSPFHIAKSFGKLFTTYTSKVLGLQQSFGIWPAASYGEGVIVGILDTGIWPESESFNDEGMSSVPQRWKGKCENGTTFSPSACNRKLIGARTFRKGLQAAGDQISKEQDFNSVRDFMGHGIHTSSTAVGNYVPGVSHFGYARGTARGVAPDAHLAMYNVSWATTTKSTFATDLLAGMEQAILDGVDILSLSLGIDQPPYFKDAIAIASLSAIEKGIFVVCSAGNDRGFKTVHNGAPWITTVGAGTLDLSFQAVVTLENGVSLEGTSYFPESVFSKAMCNYSALDREEFVEKAVFCDYSADIYAIDQLRELERVGANAAIIVNNESFTLHPDRFSTPSLILPIASGYLIKEYVAMVRNPKVESMRFVLTRLGTESAPQVALFSSEGPNPISPGVLKPDILAPGFEGLAAVSPIIPYMQVGKYDLASDYAIMSGTSTLAPHVAGVGALLKALHPEWNPAAVCYNTGTILKDQWTGLSVTPLQFEAGHINPNQAMDPGLIYDTVFQDYIESLAQKFSRVVTNVGNDDNTVYRAHLENVPIGMRIKVVPETLTFTRKNHKQGFVVSIEIDREFQMVI